MKINIRADVKAATKHLKRSQKDQIPFITSKTLNDVAFKARHELRKQAGKKLDNPTPFTLNGFQVQKSTKKHLTSVVFIEEKRYPYMKYQVYGGVRTPKNRAIVVPTKIAMAETKLNKFGNMPRKRIKQLLRRKTVTSENINGQGGIWERKKNKKLKLLAVYTQQARYRPIFHFDKIVKGVVRATLSKTLTKNIRAALKPKPI